jgi:hypothetical protein
MDSNLALSRKEKEELVLDLYFNQNKNYRQIAEEARMSPRDIGEIVNKASKEKDRQQHRSLSTQAYDLFSKGKTQLEVAIMLNIRENEVSQYHREYCSLIGRDTVNDIYREIKDNIWHFVNLYRSAKSARVDIPHVVKLLNIANNNLPSIQHEYEQLQRDISALEEDKRRAARDFQNIIDETIVIGNKLNSIQLECQNQTTHMRQLYQKRMKQEALIRQLENDNDVYNKIRKAAKENVTDALANRKELLRLAIFCVIESIRMDRDKYGPLIYYNDDNNVFSTPPQTTISPIAAYYNRSSYTYEGGQEQQQYYLTKDSFKQACIDTLNGESEKLFTSLEKILVDEVIDQYASKTSSLPMLPFCDR